MHQNSLIYRRIVKRLIKIRL